VGGGYVRIGPTPEVLAHRSKIPKGLPLPLRLPEPGDDASEGSWTDYGAASGHPPGTSQTVLSQATCSVPRSLDPALWEGRPETHTPPAVTATAATVAADVAATASWAAEGVGTVKAVAEAAAAAAAATAAGASAPSSTEWAQLVVGIPARLMASVVLQPTIVDTWLKATTALEASLILSAASNAAVGSMAPARPAVQLGFMDASLPQAAAAAAAPCAASPFFPSGGTAACASLGSGWPAPPAAVATEAPSPGLGGAFGSPMQGLGPASASMASGTALVGVGPSAASPPTFVQAPGRGLRAISHGVVLAGEAPRKLEAWELERLEQERRLEAICKRSEALGAQYKEAVKEDWRQMHRLERAPLEKLQKQELKRSEGRAAFEQKRCDRTVRREQLAVFDGVALEERADAKRYGTIARSAERCEKAAEEARRRRDAAEEAAKQLWLSTAMISVSAGMGRYREASAPELAVCVP